MVAPVHGTRSTGGAFTNQIPESWREGVLMLDPNGMAPLFGLTSKMSSQKLDSTTHHWFTQILENQRAAVTGIYSDASLQTAYTTGGVAGSVLYFKAAQDDAKHFRIGHQVLARDASDPDVDVNGKVIAVNFAGANSYVGVKLLEADDNSSSHDLSDCDTLLVIGSINPEHGARPSAISYDPTEWYNYTQIFRTSLEISRTMSQTRTRTGNEYNRLKTQAMKRHAMEIERAFFFGTRTSGTGTNGHPERTMMGVIPFIKTGASTNVVNYTLDTDYSGKTWLESGKTWFDAKLEVLFRYGMTNKLAFCGSGALLGIQKLAEEFGTMNLTPGASMFGIKVTNWTTVFGTVRLLTHPLFSFEETTRNSILLMNSENLKYLYLQDTKFKADKGGADDSDDSGIDGKQEEFITECSLELHHPITMMYMNGVGSDNSL